ncbi:MAG: helix-turn-helix transcriptional regulator [Clostridiales bacterium]|nr:helix-turn-helix transcriptional regulator [Clostridiales bacterium]
MECSFPNNLAALRHERGISQKTAAEALGISQALLSHYEKGIRECGLDFLCRAADYYGVTADYLLGRTDRRTGFSTADDSAHTQRRELCRILELLYDIADKAAGSPLADGWDAFLRAAVYRSARLLLEACDGRPQELFSLQSVKAQAAAAGLMDMAAARLAPPVIDTARGVLQQPGRPAPYVSKERLLADYPDAAPSLLLLLQDIEEKLVYSLTRFPEPSGVHT